MTDAAILLSPPVELAAWLASAAFVTLLFNQAAKAWFTLRGRPSPRESAAADAALSSRMGKLEQRHENCAKANGARIGVVEVAVDELRRAHLDETRRIYDKVSRDIGGVHNRINAVAESNAGISGQIDSLRTLLVTRLTAHPDRSPTP